MAEGIQNLCIMPFVHGESMLNYHYSKGLSEYDVVDNKSFVYYAPHFAEEVLRSMMVVLFFWNDGSIGLLCLYFSHS